MYQIDERSTFENLELIYITLYENKKSIRKYLVLKKDGNAIKYIQSFVKDNELFQIPVQSIGVQRKLNNIINEKLIK